MIEACLQDPKVMGTLHTTLIPVKCFGTHSLVKVHVVGDYVDIGMEDLVLLDHLLQDVTHAS